MIDDGSEAVAEYVEQQKPEFATTPALPRKEMEYQHCETNLGKRGEEDAYPPSSSPKLILKENQPVICTRSFYFINLVGAVCEKREGLKKKGFFYFTPVLNDFGRPQSESVLSERFERRFFFLVRINKIFLIITIEEIKTSASR